ncbi:unnamed protein product, partial [Mesorhabditis spiculigera]
MKVAVVGLICLLALIEAASLEDQIRDVQAAKVRVKRWSKSLPRGQRPNRSAPLKAEDDKENPEKPREKREIIESRKMGEAPRVQVQAIQEGPGPLEQPVQPEVIEGEPGREEGPADRKVDSACIVAVNSEENEDENEPIRGKRDGEAEEFDSFEAEEPRREQREAPPKTDIYVRVKRDTEEKH